MNAPKRVSPAVINAFFLTGLFSSVCFRVLPIANTLWPASFRHIWYAGVIGYCLFFLYRWGITRKRQRTIANMQLIDKLERGALTDEDRKAVHYLLSSIAVSKEGLNYLVIFILSAVAIAVDLYLAG
jgi:hypothetical protein